MSAEAQEFKGKRIAVCMDGTWQRLRSETPTNIAKLARAVDHEDAHGAKQIVVYTRGVGAANDLNADADGALAGGLFGAGLETDILDTYIRICLNYQWGDALYIFGYSRGAYSARSLGGLIRRCGIVRRRHIHEAAKAFDLYRKRFDSPDAPELVEFRRATNKLRPEAMDKASPPEIHFIGIFDTVGQRGLPSGLGFLTDWFNRKFEFHSTDLGSTVRAARHAVAVDERRFAFPPTLWTNLDELNAPHLAAGVGPYRLPYQQRWFPGAHGDVGGGDPRARLANIPLAWIVEGAMQAGLKFDLTEGTPLGEAARADLLDPAAPFSAPARGLRVRKLPLKGKVLDPAQAAMLLHPATPARALKLGRRYRSPTLRVARTTLRQLRAALAVTELLLLAAGPLRNEVNSQSA